MSCAAGRYNQQVGQANVASCIFCEKDFHCSGQYNHVRNPVVDRPKLSTLNQYVPLRFTLHESPADNEISLVFANDEALGNVTLLIKSTALGNKQLFPASFNTSNLAQAWTLPSKNVTFTICSSEKCTDSNEFRASASEMLLHDTSYKLSVRYRENVSTAGRCGTPGYLCQNGQVFVTSREQYITFDNHSGQPSIDNYHSLNGTVQYEGFTLQMHLPENAMEGSVEFLLSASQGGATDTYTAVRVLLPSGVQQAGNYNLRGTPFHIRPSPIKTTLIVSTPALVHGAIYSFVIKYQDEHENPGELMLQERSSSSSSATLWSPSCPQHTESSRALTAAHR